MMRLKGLRTISELILSSSLYVVLPVFIMVVLLMSGGCMKTDRGKISEGAEMQFTVGSTPSTKTAYKHGDKSLQLIWVDGDQVSIFCDQAQGEGNKKEAAYNVTPQSDSTKGNLSIAEGDGIGLRWNDDKTKLHNLYAVYPSKNYSRGNVIKESDEGVFTFNFPKTQECSIAGGYTAVNGSYMLKPDMYLAYMVAKKEDLTPENNAVELKFKPIATTLEITLQGAAQGDVEVSRLDLELLVTNTVNGNASDNNRLVNENGDVYQIQFNAKKDYSLDVYNSLVAYPSSNLPQGSAFFSVKLPAGEGGKYTIGAGKSVTFTVFLPPIKNLDNVTVKCIGSDGATELGRKQIFVDMKYASPASKSFFKLPPFTGGGATQSFYLEASPSKVELMEGGYATIRIYAVYPTKRVNISSPYKENVTITVKDPDIAKFGYHTAAASRIYAEKVGATEIEVSYTDTDINETQTLTIPVTVIGKDYTLVDLNVYPKGTTIKVGETVQLKASAGFKYLDLNNQEKIDYISVTTEATWSPTSGSYATVDNSSSKGLVTGKSVGSQIITATYTRDGVTVSDTTLIKVTPTVTVREITVKPDPLNIERGKRGQLVAKVTMSDESNRTTGITWKINSTKVVTQFMASDNYIVLEGESVGSTTVTATYGGVSATATVNVTEPTVVPTKILKDLVVESTTGSTSIKVGETLQLRATAYYTDNSNSIVTTSCTWSPTSGSYATVSNSSGSKGLVTGKSVGSQVIKASYTENGVNKTHSITITVTQSTTTYTPDYYYMWDAPVGAYYKSTYPINNYNTTNNNPSRSCANTPSYDQLQMYLAAELFWVTDGPAYKLPNGNTYRTGLMVKKSGKIPGFKEGTAQKELSVKPPTKGVSYESLKDDYFFLPACGSYRSGSFINAGTGGTYWGSWPWSGIAYYFALRFDFTSEEVSIGGVPRYFGLVPLDGFDPTYTR